MALSPDKGRASITSSLSNIQKVYQAAPMSVALSMFKDAKFDELVNVYSKAPSDEREGVYELFEPIYPAERTRLEQIKNGQTTK
jgi:glycerol-3-phosphate cytidylyltransferase-like family protein